MGAGHRHLVLDGQGDEHGRALHDRRRARGNRHAHVDGRRRAQPRRRDDAARDHDGRDVDGRDPRQRRARRARVGIICLDHSECSIEDNTIAGTRSTRRDPQRSGVAIQAHFFAKAQLEGNTVVASPGGIEALDNSTIRPVTTPPNFHSSPARAIRTSSTCRGATPLEEWQTERFVNLIRGISRHIVRFVEYDGTLYALKELPERPARREWTLLRRLEGQGLPVVEPVGIVTGRGDDLDAVLITRHLEYSLPYRALFSGRGDPRPAHAPAERARRAARAPASARLLLGRLLALERALPPRRRRADGVPRRRGDRRAARRSSPTASGATTSTSRR